MNQLFWKKELLTNQAVKLQSLNQSAAVNRGNEAIANSWKMLLVFFHLLVVWLKLVFGKIAKKYRNKGVRKV